MHRIKIEEFISMIGMVVSLCMPIYSSDRRRKKKVLQKIVIRSLEKSIYSVWDLGRGCQNLFSINSSQL